MSEDEYLSDSSIASDYGLLKKALPFECDIPDNFDPNKVPETAEEFLQFASYERSQMKPWVTAEIHPSKLTGRNFNKVIVEEINNFIPSDFLPSQEWQKRKLKEFVEFRDFIHAKMKSSSINLLKSEDITAEILNEPPKYFKLIKYSQADKIKVLEAIINNLGLLETGTTFRNNFGAWMYAMLILLETPLHSDDCHVVRLLAKKCITIRSNYKENVKEMYHPLNLFICIISKFYRQLDLSDP